MAMGRGRGNGLMCMVPEVLGKNPEGECMLEVDLPHELVGPYTLSTDRLFVS